MITCIKKEDEDPNPVKGPKSVQMRNMDHHSDEFVDQENVHRAETNNIIMKSPTPEEKAEKYGLRPRTIIKRLQQETRCQEPPAKPKPKGKRTKKARPAPLSKYRRKTANARERDRMNAVNVAFESLRRVLSENVDLQQGSATTNTKIHTLRHAVDYIQALTKVLENPQQQQQEYARDNIVIKKEQICEIKSERGCEAERKSLPHLLYNTNSVINTQHQKCSSQQLQTNQHILIKPKQLYIPELNLINYEVRTASDVPVKQAHDFSSLLASCPDQSYLSLSSNSSTSLDSHGSSTSDLDELLSDDSHFLEGNLNVFQDISSFSETDPFDILLPTDSGCDTNSICYTRQMYS